MKIKHIDKFPPAPTLDELFVYEWHLRAARDGLAYQTGPRRGQQLAERLRQIASKP